MQWLKYLALALALFLIVGCKSVTHRVELAPPHSYVEYAQAQQASDE